jgi:WD40 repeat protein
MRYWSRLYVRLPRKALQGGWEGGTFAEHAGAVTSVCFSADGRHALSGSADRTLRLWEVATGRCLRVFEGHEGGVTAVCLRPDGRHALSGGSDATLRLWDVATGRCLGTYGGQADVITSVALSGDGRRALSGSTDGTAQLWDVASGRRLRVLEGHTDPVHSVCLSADGRYALSGGAQFLVRNESERLFTSGQLKLWDTASGRCLPTFEGHTDAVTAVALGADGRHALSGGGQSVIGHNTGRFSQSGQVYLWELATGRRLGTCTGHTDAVTAVCPSVDGRYALSGSTDRTVKLWEAAGGQCLRTFAGHAGAVTAVALSADGRHALSGSTDGTLKLWILDWELEDSPPADWHEGALPYLEMFLALHTPYAARLCGDRKRTVKELMQLPLTRLFRSAPTEEEVAQALTRRGKPSWTENDFQDLLFTLGCAGYGWLRPEGVRRKLEQMARSWQGPPLLPST